MGTYCKTDNQAGDDRKDVVLRTTDDACIFADTHNTDWQAYQAWLAAGNKPTDQACRTVKDTD